MSKKGKSWHFIVVALLIVVFALTSLFGISYQYGDTKTTYVKGVCPTSGSALISAAAWMSRSCRMAMWMPRKNQLKAAQTVINDRLVGLGVTDYESYIDANKDRIIVRFPWRSGRVGF